MEKVKELHQKKKKLSMGTVDEFCIKIDSDKCVEKFTCDEQEDKIFIELLNKKSLMYFDLSSVRKKCREKAKMFNYDLGLFNRFPMWVYRYLAADDPLCKDSGETRKIEIFTVFMFINKISPELMMAFYIEAGQSIEDAFNIHKFLVIMKKIYDKHDRSELIGLFGDWFTYHCQSQTLRRIDMSLVEYGVPSRNNAQFIPDKIQWRRQRVSRRLLRTGEYTVNDDMDLMELKRSVQNGLRYRGRFRDRNAP